MFYLCMLLGLNVCKTYHDSDYDAILYNVVFTEVLRFSVVYEIFAATEYFTAERSDENNRLNL